MRPSVASIIPASIIMLVVVFVRPDDKVVALLGIVISLLCAIYVELWRRP